MSESEIQHRYYTEVAEKYDEMHLNEKDEHFLALCFLVAALEYYNIESVLDIGSGTGRAITYLKEQAPHIHVIGIEPVKELREVGYRKGLSVKELFEGDATNVPFSAGEFDLVCEFGVLHHIKHPERAVAEMLRVAKRAIFISDSNNFGQGSFLTRIVKHTINFFGLWNVANLIKSRGKGYTLSAGDGLAYSYSVFNNHAQIKKQCQTIHLLNTKDGHINPYKTASHVALLGIKKQS